MAKIQVPRELLASVGITVDSDGTGMFRGRHVRLLYTGVFEVGDNDFDRWANSSELEIDIAQAKGQRQLAKWVNSFNRLVD